MNKFKDILSSAFSLESDSATPEDIRETILSGARVRGTNMCILMLAIFVASIGLNMNSTPVIIGAMLISPLMGGIMAIGYGIALNDLKLARNASLGLIFQVLICIITSNLYFSLTPILTAHSELLARTNPTIWDVLIAIFGGLAGIIGVTRKEKTNVLPGVAIATALMPPLCTAGYGIATRSLTFFAGAMYLFFINSFFICISTVTVIKLMRLPKQKFIDSKAHRKVRHTIYIIAIITVLPSIYLAYQIVKESVFDNNIEQYISREFVFDGTQVVKSYVDKDTKEIEVALLGKRLDESAINSLNASLKDYNLSDMKLVVTQTELSEGVTFEDIQSLIEKEYNQKTSNTQQEDIENLKSDLVKYKAQILEYQTYDFDIESITKELRVLYPQIKNCSVGQLKSWDNAENQSVTNVVANISTSTPLTYEQKLQLTAWLETKTNKQPIYLFENIEDYTLPNLLAEEIQTIRLKLSDQDEIIENNDAQLRSFVSNSMANCKIKDEVKSLNEISKNDDAHNNPNTVTMILNSGKQIIINCYYSDIPYINITVDGVNHMYYVENNWDIKFIDGIKQQLNIN